MISVMMMITMMTMMEMEGIRDDKRICLFSTSMHFQMMLKRMEARMMGMMTLLSCLMMSSSKLVESNPFASAIASALYCDS